jgi:hypothetical protein
LINMIKACSCGQLSRILINMLKACCCEQLSRMLVNMVVILESECSTVSCRKQAYMYIKISIFYPY